MAERPILMSTPLVQAVLAGRKTQTRRPIKPQPEQPPTNHYENLATGEVVWGYSTGTTPPQGDLTYRRGDGSEYTKPLAVGLCKTFKPAYAVGDVLWVRETWFDYGPGVYHYRADGDPEIARIAKECGLWRPSIHMPRDAARLFLEVTDVRAERYDAIREADAVAEGVEQLEPDHWRCYDRTIRNPQARCMSARGSFLTLWESIYGDSQPWAWVYGFKRVPAPAWAEGGGR